MTDTEPRTIPIAPDDPDYAFAQKGLDIKQLSEDIVSRLKLKGEVEPDAAIKATTVIVPDPLPRGVPFEVQLTIYLNNGKELQCKLKTTIFTAMH